MMFVVFAVLSWAYTYTEKLKDMSDYCEKSNLRPLEC